MHFVRALTFALCFAVGLAGCAGGGNVRPAATATASAEPVGPGLVPPAQGISGADWPTFAHDYARSGYQPERLAIAKSTAASLKLRWTKNLGTLIKPSPIIGGGLLYIGGDDGIMYALDARSGKLVWKRPLGAPIQMTPTLANGKLFVGTHTVPSIFAALDAATGKILWRTPLHGCVRSEPVVANGLVFEGESCGDPGLCYNGGMRAFDEQTGAIRWRRNVTAVPKNGGAQWSPVSYDGRRLYFGTGNICKTASPLGDALVAISPSGKIEWSFQAANPLSDDDFGGGAMLNNGQIFVPNKNGVLYDFDAASGKILWQKQIGFVDGYGSAGTPTTDGSIVIVSSGYRSDPTMTKDPPGGGLMGIDANGKTRWTILTQNDVFGYAAICNGIAFAGLDTNLAALDASTGAVLWKYPAKALMYASPAIVRSGLYSADMAGNVYAFSLPGSD
jgi:polyvinyl alcohol dehydrogenase (cytochrome)